MSRKIVCLLLVSFVALAAVNFAAAEEKKAVAAPAAVVTTVTAAPCDCAGPVVYAPAPVYHPYVHHPYRYYAPVYAPVCEPCYSAPVVYRRGLLGFYRPFYAW